MTPGTPNYFLSLLFLPGAFDIILILLTLGALRILGFDKELLNPSSVVATSFLFMEIIRFFFLPLQTYADELAPTLVSQYFIIGLFLFFLILTYKMPFPSHAIIFAILCFTFQLFMIQTKTGSITDQVTILVNGDFDKSDLPERIFGTHTPTKTKFELSYQNRDEPHHQNLSGRKDVPLSLTLTYRFWSLADVKVSYINDDPIASRNSNIYLTLEQKKRFYKKFKSFRARFPWSKKPQ